MMKSRLPSKFILLFLSIFIGCIIAEISLELLHDLRWGKKANMFMDTLHLDERGNKVMAKTVADHIKKKT